MDIRPTVFFTRTVNSILGLRFLNFALCPGWSLFRAVGAVCSPFLSLQASMGISRDSRHKRRLTGE